MDCSPVPFFALWLLTNHYGSRRMSEGWRKFGIHFAMWFSAVTLGLGGVNLSGAAFDWAWIALVFCATAFPVPYHEWQEYRARFQDGAKTRVDILAVVSGVGTACLVAGVWWWKA